MIGAIVRAAAATGLLALLAAAGTASAQESSAGGATAPGSGGSPAELSEVTVTATRIAQPAFDVPASIDSVAIAADTLGVNASESLQGIAGLVANNRQNYAQDEQISVRGFGARAAFGISGVRIYMDGIPASQPDGQGQVSQFNLASASRIEVLRGPFSALYGNSAGGVIQLFTADGSGPPRATAAVAYGSFDERRGSADVLGSDGAFSYNVGGSLFATAGSRGHSAARRTSVQGKWGVDFGAGGHVTLLANYFDSPNAQDPLGLTAAQFAADPQGTAPSAALFNTRKSADQTQGGALYDLPVGQSNAFRLMLYGGHRDVLQFLSIPVGSQRSPTSSGGVVDLGNDYGGVEPRWSWHGKLGGGNWSITAGLTYDVLREDRTGYNNFIGTTLGVQGALRRHDNEHIYDLDQYLQSEWQSSRWNALLGVRRSRVHFSSTELYIPAGQSYSGGSVDYGATAPVAGALFHITPDFNVYASYGQGFETPTFAQLAYRPSGESGLNFDLRAERTHSYELGAKLRISGGGSAQLALFRADTANEITVESNTGGRSVYGNAGRTLHQGVELSLLQPLAAHWQLQAAYTYLDAHVQTAYLTCASVPCALPSTAVAAGSRIPGVATSRLYAQLQWEPLPEWRWQLQDRYVGDVYVDDANTTYAGAYDVVALITDYTWHLSDSSLHAFLRLDNLLDRHYAGSVIVNQTSGQYFEAGPPRSVLAGVSYSF